MIQSSLLDGYQRDSFMNALRDGQRLNCPCCGRHAQVYKRSMHHTAARQLITLYRLGGHSDFVHAREFIGLNEGGGGDFAKARFWGLLEKKDLEEGEDKKSSGLWRLTHKGVLFVQCKLTIDRFVFIYDDKAERFDGPQVNIKDCLGTKFSYYDLMNCAG